MEKPLREIKHLQITLNNGGYYHRGTPRHPRASRTFMRLKSDVLLVSINVRSCKRPLAGIIMFTTSGLKAGRCSHADDLNVLTRLAFLSWMSCNSSSSAVRGRLHACPT